MNVYLICSEIGDEKLYKIGFTRRRIEDRIKEFETGNGTNLFIVDSFKSKWATKIESKIHKIFKSKKIKGEWFYLNEDDISMFNKYCEIIHNNYEIISTQNTYFLEKIK